MLFDLLGIYLVSWYTSITPGWKNIKYAILALTILFPCIVLSAEKTAPIEWHGYALAEDTSNLHGGIRNGSIYTVAGHLAAEIDTQTMDWWRGGKFVFGVLGIGQSHIQYFYTGAVQSPSSVTAQPEIKIANLAYEQEINNKLQIRLGIMDIDEHFNQSEVAIDLLNTSFTNTVSMAYGALLPTYPFPGIGAEIEYKNNDWILQAAVYQGNPRNQGSIFHRGFFALGEAVYKIQSASNNNIKYTAKFGIWNYYQPLRLQSFTNHGIYAIGEATWDSNWGPQFGFAIQGGANVYKTPSVPYSAAACFTITRLIAYRPKDSLNFALGRAWVYFDSFNKETYFEISYAMQIIENLKFIPDIQYFVEPTGIYPNAWVALARLTYTL